ncbi:cytochrome c oxidase subunit 6C-1-like [Anneissia japonica]|uniref:cytochrome c oxidase subunit 6C-1-like n=1 Tax=Anneissia japonica TaxID=1529436 RepID=UPI001425B524|nr:cytochrome c oxidase subunit 6C-1-like [Anneissia japonica]
MSLVRPKMRGLLQAALKKHFLIGCTLAIASAYATKVYMLDSRKAAYQAFYKDYDMMKDFERMRDLGVFHSVKPAGSEE